MRIWCVLEEVGVYSLFHKSRSFMVSMPCYDWNHGFETAFLTALGSFRQAIILALFMQFAFRAVCTRACHRHMALN